MSAPARTSSFAIKRSAITGVIAAAIYLIIALATGGSFGVAMVGIAVLVGLVAFAISYAIATYKTNHRSV